jgi:8-oxo-dGTP diphosphatase
VADEQLNNKVRVRANGILIHQNSVLLVQLKTPIFDYPYWMPPGGGLEFGETLQEAVKREMLEETGISVDVGELWFVNEYINSPWHAIEFYFKCSYLEGELVVGKDPELTNQYIINTAFVSFDEFLQLTLRPPFLKEQLILKWNETENNIGIQFFCK